MTQIYSTDQIRVPFLTEEEGRYATHNGIQTITFFNANNNAAGMGNAPGLVFEHMRTKMKLILEANPWMCGHLEKANKHNGNVNTLTYDEKLTDLHINSVLDLPPRVANFTRHTSYEELNDECIKFGLSNKDKMMKSGAPITKVVVMPTTDQEVAILFSMSHYCVDGHTYYKLLSMLSSTAPVVALNIKRIPQAEYTAMEQRLSGKPLLTYGAPSAAYLKHIIWNNVLVKQPFDEIICKYIDPDLVKQAKTAATHAGIAAGEHDVTYVSTNDLIVSLLGQVTKVGFLMQTINYRGREPSLLDTHAGNYENVCAYDEPGYSSAVQVRKSLQNIPYGNTQGGKMPHFCTVTRMTFYTSWLFPFDFNIEGCEHALHLPLMNLNPSGGLNDPLNAPFDVAISFHPQPGKIALLIFARRAGVNEWMQHPQNILGDTVCKHVFGPFPSFEEEEEEEEATATEGDTLTGAGTADEA